MQSAISVCQILTRYGLDHCLSFKTNLKPSDIACLAAVSRWSILATLLGFHDINIDANLAYNVRKEFWTVLRCRPTSNVFRRFICGSGQPIDLLPLASLLQQSQHEAQLTHKHENKCPARDFGQ
jgi:hypothetical protein